MSRRQLANERDLESFDDDDNMEMSVELIRKPLKKPRRPHWAVPPKHIQKANKPNRGGVREIDDADC